MKTMTLIALKWWGWDGQKAAEVLTPNEEPGLIECALDRVACCFGRHRWNHCTCRSCDKVRDENHAFAVLPGETCKAECRLCGLPKSLHIWDKHGVCQRCGEPKFHRWVWNFADDGYATAITAHLSLRN
jgi:hypothetical protein